MAANDKTIVHDVADLLARAGESSAYLIAVAGRSSAGKMFKLDRAEMVIGRSPEADIQLEDEGVSRRHAKVVVRSDGSVQLVDLNSTNGTYNNGARVDVQALEDGDRLQIGSATIVKFSCRDSFGEALQKNLYDSTTRDGLTRLHNEKYFAEALQRELAYCARHRTALSLTRLDIDHLKRINDTYGHPAGNHVIARFGARLASAIRAEDILARFEGGSFALLLRETDLGKAVALAERLRRLIEATEFAYNGQPVRVTLSAGLSTLGEADGAFDGLLAMAERHLERAKETGHNRVEARRLGP